MPSAFEHFILTRFAVRFLEDQPTPDDAWLEYRLGFFREAAVPSLRGQSLRNFRWLIFCDAGAPEWLREEFAELSDGLFEPVWLDRIWSPMAAREAVAERLGAASHLITTRLDSDDALGVGFVETVQRQFEGQSLEYVNVVRGLQVDRSLAVYRYDYASNPFLSLIEVREPGAVPRTVFVDPRHGMARHNGPVRDVRSAPLWLQVVHDGNLMNDVRGIRVSPRELTEAFTIDLDYRRSVSSGRLWRERVVQWGRRARMWVRHPAMLKQSLAGSWAWWTATGR